MLRRVILHICLYIFVYNIASANAIKDTLRNSTFIDPSCIAPQFGYEELGNDSREVYDLHDIIGADDILSAAGAAVNMISDMVTNDAGQSGSNTNSINNYYRNAKYKDATFLELKVKIYDNLLKFVKQNITATKDGTICSNPIADKDCVIIDYIMPDGTEVTTDKLYTYVVYSALYGYISSTVLDAGDEELEKVRAVFSAGYSDADSRSFADRMKEVVNQTPFVNNLFNQKISDILYSTTGSDGVASTSLLESSASSIAQAMSTDALFFQKLGYSSYARFPITSRLVECLEGTFANLFLRDLQHVPLTPYKIVQIYFQPLIILLLIIYIIARGYQIIMAHGIKDKNEMIIFFVQFGLVFYFAIGDAWKDFFFSFLKSFGSTVATIVLESLPGSADGCSVYKPYMYPDGKGNLALFDAIDCKIVNYFGLPENAFLPGVFYIIVMPVLTMFDPSGISQSVGWLISLSGILYTKGIIYTILIGIQTYIVSIISLGLLLFLTPLVAPMALFSLTKEVYDKWLTKIIGTVIQQSMSIVMIVITLAILDSIIYGANAETKLFDQREQLTSAAGIPQANLIKGDCYGGNWFHTVFAGGGGSNSGLLLGVTPPACILHKYTKLGVAWIGTPIPGFLWYFKVPFNYRFDYMIAFLLPAIITVISLALIKKIIDPLQLLIDQISGQQSFDAFGAQKYSTFGDAADKAQKTIAAVKASNGDASAAKELTEKDSGNASESDPTGLSGEAGVDNKGDDNKGGGDK